MCFTGLCNILKREAFARRSKMLTRRRVSLGEQGQPEETRRSVNLILLAVIFRAGFPGGVTGKEPTCQCRRRRFDPWARKIPCSRKWHPIPVFLPGKFHGQRSLVGYSPWCHKESDMTEQLSLSLSRAACQWSGVHRLLSPFFLPHSLYT